MKKSFLLIISLCAIAFQPYARQSQQDPSRIEKKSFSGIEEVRFDHSYGNITVTESNSSQIELEIRYFENEDYKLDCNTSITGKTVHIKTIRPNNVSCNSCRIGIDYIVAIPKETDMNVNIKYGNINMGDFYGDFTGNMAYSNLNAGTFYKSPVNIAGKYSTMKISEAGVLNLSIDYTNISVNTLGTFKVQSKYSHYKIDRVETVDADCSYGGININAVTDFSATLRYTPTEINSLGKKLNLQCSYSAINVDSSSDRLETFIFNGSYSNLKLKLDPGLSANLKVDMEFGNLSVDDRLGVKYSFSEKDHRSVSKIGVIGSRTPTADIRIRNSYASVKIGASGGKLSGIEDYPAAESNEDMPETTVKAYPANASNANMPKTDSIIESWKTDGCISKSVSISPDRNNTTNWTFYLGDSETSLNGFVQTLKNEIRKSPVVYKTANGETLYELYSSYDDINHITHYYSYNMEDSTNIEVIYTTKQGISARLPVDENIRSELDKGMERQKEAVKRQKEAVERQKEAVERQKEAEQRQMEAVKRQMEAEQRQIEAVKRQMEAGKRNK
ncbi:MAG: hypothetical protein LBQ01_09110 [Prevotellaceae bacterium]|jgi:hypothetical protein|nr:hypothetical protein [Prevotellaceae bacterium]